MNKFNLIILITISFLSMTGCFSKAEEQKSTNTEVWDVVLQESQCGIFEPRNIVIKSQKEFDALWEESQKGIDLGPIKPIKPKVDFYKKWVIASFLGTVNTGGHSLEIESIKASPEMVLITIIHKRPGRNCFTAQVIEFPCLMATVDHFIPEKVEFKAIIQDMPCK